MTQRLFIFIAAIILLSSCSGKLGITKRRYTKGFYVSHKKDKPDVKKQDIKKEVLVLEQIKVEEKKHETSLPAIKVQENNIVSTASVNREASGQAVLKNHQKATVSVSKQIFVDKIPSFKSVLLSAKKDLKQKKSSDDSKVMLVLMVILCLFPFINLIPVYLHDNDVTINFLITLLLDFLLIVGVIFALLVVLDVVDLR